MIAERGGTARERASARAAATAHLAPQRWDPKDRYAAYTSAASLGINDDSKEDWEARRAKRKSAAAAPGAWEDVQHTPPSYELAAPAPPPSTLTERDEARTFQVRERTAQYSDNEDDVPITVKRARGGSVADGLDDIKQEREDDIKPEDGEAMRGEIASPALDTRKGVKEEHETPSEDTLAPPASASESVHGAIKREPLDSSAPSDQQPSDTLFRKRKARGSTKKVSSAFA